MTAKIAEQWIAHTLATEQRPVTFRELAREVGCNIQLAKNHLLHYYNAHADVAPTYLLSGPLLGSSSVGETALPSTQGAVAAQSLAHLSATQKVRIVNMDEVSDGEANSEAGDEAGEGAGEGDLDMGGEGGADGKGEGEDEGGEEEVEEEIARWGVVLVAEGDLEEKRKLFVPGQANVHIYAITPAPIKDPAQLLSSAVLLRQHAAYRDAKYGGITGDGFGKATGAALRDGAMDFGSKPKAAKAEPEAAGSKKPVKTEPEVKVKTEVKAESAKKEASVERKVSPPLSKPALARKDSSSKPTTKSRRRVIASDDEHEEEETQASTTSRISAKTALEPTSSMVRAGDQAAMEAMMAMDVDDFDDEPEAKQESAAEPAKQPAPKAGGKRKRKVKKSKVEMDERGYMVTKDYYTEEECSGSETETESLPPPKAASKAASAAKAKPAAKPSREPSRSTSEPEKPKPPPRGSVPKKGQMGQSTLAGFFKKK